MPILSSNGTVLYMGSNILTSEFLPPQGFTNPDNWDRYAGNPIITPGAGGSWDANWVAPVHVMKVGNEYWMYYAGSDSGGASGDPIHIGLAISPDGLTWTKYGSNPLISPGSADAWDDYKVNHMSIMLEDGIYKGWYSGRKNDGIWKIGYITSADGLSWTKYGSNPILDVGGGGAWDSAFILTSGIFKEGTTYFLYYWGGTSAADMTTWKIGLATSSDGINWSKHASNPVFSGVVGEWDDGVLTAHIIRIGKIYYMFYQGNTSDGANSAIGIATSSDKITWERIITNPFPRIGAWDNAWNEDPYLINIDGTWMLYHMGYNLTTFGIGLMLFNP